MSEKQAITPIYKGMRFRKFKTADGGYKDGVRLTSKKEIGIIIPFERDFSNLCDGVKTILGFNYPKWIFNYWIPKIVKVKEMMITRKPVKLKNKIFSLSDGLEGLVVDKCSFYKRVKRNYIYDFNSILAGVFPQFDDISKWNSARAYKNIDNFILEWLQFVLINPNMEQMETIKTSMFMHGGGVKDMHDIILMGIKIPSLNQNVVKFLDPSVKIPRLIKANLSNYIPLVILRAFSAGLMGYKEDKYLLKLFDILKDISIVFYNLRGNGFIINTIEDENVKKLEGTQILVRLKTLYRMIISTNDPNSEDFDDEDPDEVLEKPDEHKDIVEDPEFEKLVDSVVNSEVVGKVANKTISKKRTRKKDIEEDFDEVIEPDDDEIEKSLDEEEEEELKEIIEFDEDEDDIEEEEEIDKEDVKSIISTLERENKPTQTPAQIQRRKILKEKYKSLEIDGRSFPEILEDEQSKVIDRKIPKVTIMDESLKGSKLVDFERSYVEKTMEHDILNVIKSFSDNKTINFHIVDVAKEDTSDQNTAKNTYTFKFIDDNDRRHSIKIDIPKVDKDGFLLIGGNRKLLKKQLILLPIVKTRPDTVMITSNYNKCFMYRHGSSITKGVSVLLKLLNNELKSSSKFKYFRGDNIKENKDFLTNIEYDILAESYHRFIIGSGKNSTEYIFNQKELRSKISEELPKYKFSDNKLPVGIDYFKKEVISVDLSDDGENNVSDLILKNIENYNVIKNLEEVTSKMNIVKRRMFTKIELQSRDFALVAFLGGLFGLSKVINTEKIKVEFSDKKIRGDKRLFIRFKDSYLYYSDNNIASTLLLNGLAYMSPEEYSISDFDTETPYIEYFFNIAKSRNVYKGHTAFRDLFLDHITKEVLKDLNLPTDFLEVFLYANSLLADNNHTKETSLENYRARGFENISVLLYKIMAPQYALYKQNNIGTGRISVQQDQLMVKLHKSMILENYDSTNPVNELKNKSIITFKGPCGVNNDRVFSLEKRAYDQSAIGTIAISSVDGPGIGIVKQLTVNPKINSTRGYITPCKDAKEAKGEKLGNIASPEEADVAFVNYHDDPKRINFTSGQTKHTIKVKGASPPVVSTGHDKVSPYMVGNSFVPKAAKDGIIEKIDDDKKFIIIKYNDGTKEVFEYGLNIQRNSSFFFGNELELNVKEGQKVKTDDILAYEKDFFKKDVFGNIRSSQGVLAKMILHEKSVTDEDSSTLTERLSNKLGTDIIIRKQISLSKDANIISYRKVGDKVLKGDSILVFEDSGDDMTNELLESLGGIDENILAMAKQSPKANATGTIVDMKIFFTKPLEEYSDSIYKMINKWAKDVKDKINFEKQYEVKDTNREVMLKPTKPNQTGTEARINGAIIPEGGGVVIEYYINHPQGMGVGDKVTMNSNIKSVVAQIIPEGEEPITEDGEILDGVVGLTSIQARMTYSPIMNGVLSHALVSRSKEIAKKYLQS